MADLADFETLLLLCHRSPSLPPMPGTVMRLIREIDEGDAPNAKLEQIISSDPALTAAFMRWAALEDEADHTTSSASIQNSILIHGHRAVRNLAVSLIVQSSIRTPVDGCDFDAQACAHHSVFVAILAQYIALRSHMGSDRTRDVADVYAAGILHQLPLYLLAKLAPHVYNRVDRYARKHEVSYERSFEMLYGHPIGELGAATCRVWHLPDVFARFMLHFSEPWMAEELERGICAIRYADWLASRTEWRMEAWTVHDELPIEVFEEVGFPEEEQDLVLQRVAAMAESYYPKQPTGRVFSPRRL